jgi:hypothetical protein
MTGSAKAVRRLPDWINAFVEYTSDLPSPLIFRKWAAISAIAGAMEQRVWVRSLGNDLYPNLYTILVGPPGIGKTVITNEVEALWGTVDELKIAPQSLSKASMVDAMAAAKRRIVRPGKTPALYDFHHLLVVSSELSDLIPVYDPPFMSILQSLYGPLKTFRDRKRSHNKGEEVVVERPALHLLGATTPSFMNSLMPEGAWDQGFISRTILVYSGENTIRPLFDEPAKRKELFNDLAHDLAIIASDETFGQMEWQPEAAAAISQWHSAGGEPKPAHIKLTHYNTRRTAHLLKLCITTCMGRGDQAFVISLDDFNRALDLLTEVERYMADIFKSMGVGGDSAAIDETWYMCYESYKKDQKPIPENRLVAFLAQRVPAHSVRRVIEIMERGHILEQIGVSPQGQNLFKPAPKQTHH